MPDPSKTCGIYAIVNHQADRVYIGKTIKSFTQRWLIHTLQLSAGEHNNSGLQRDWIEMGSAAFDFVVVHAFPTKLPHWLFNSLSALERITVFESECWLYNIAPMRRYPDDKNTISWLYTGVIN